LLGAKKLHRETMTESPATAASVAAQLRLIASQSGRFGIAARLDPDSVDAVATRIAAGLSSDFTEAQILTELSKFKQKHPGHFRSNAQLATALRKAWQRAQNPHKPDDDATREALALLTNEEKHIYANTGQLPRRIGATNVN
jgi:alkylhydroperoxidase family enzyme